MTPLGLRSLAAELGITYRSAITYHHDGRLPEPDGYVGRSPWWWPETVRAWKTERAYLRDPPDRE